MKRVFHSLIAAAAILVLSLPALGSTATVTLKAEAEVEAEQAVTIGDIATIEAPADLAARIADLSISGAPFPGSRRTISAAYVDMKLRSARLDEEVTLTGAASVSVRAQGLTLSSDDLAEEARNYILNQLPQDNRNYEVELDRAPREVTTAYSEDYQVRTRLMSSAIRLGTNTVAIDVVVDGKTVATTSAALQVKAIADVLVAQEAITDGSAISLQNACWEQRDITRTPDAVVMPEGGHIPDWVAKRSLNSGSVITLRDITVAPAVNYGDTVTLIVRCGQVTLRATAQCKDDGGIGETVRVRSSVSSEDVQALVVQPGIVEINR